jgi:hypothetical protein
MVVRGNCLGLIGSDGGLTGGVAAVASTHAAMSKIDSSDLIARMNHRLDVLIMREDTHRYFGCGRG